MISAEQISGLLQDLYAAPLEPKMWQAFMNRLCAQASVECGYLIVSHWGGGVMLAGGGTSFDPEMFRIYSEHYASCDPYSAPLLQHPVIGCIEGDEIVEHRELLKTEVYNDFLKRYGLESTTVVMPECNNEQLQALLLWRGPQHGPMDAEWRRVLEMLVPHLQTALRLREMAIEHERLRVFSEMALDGMPVAAFLVTGEGRVRHMNGRAKALVEPGSGLAICGGKLVAGNGKETAQLERLLRGATTCHGRGLELCPGGAMRVLRAQNPLQITVVPAPEVNGFAGRERCALVFVSDPGARSRSRAEFMRQLYALTPTECRLADLLLDGMDVAEAADRLRVTLGTARFHLKRIFEKTGVRRQPELIRLMLLLPVCRQTAEWVAPERAGSPEGPGVTG